MINNDMRLYNYFTLGEQDDYGQVKIPDKNSIPIGQIKIAINITSQGIQENINYKDAQYIGLTHADINDKYIIQYGDVRLKVLYINPRGRYKQVFLKEM